MNNNLPKNILIVGTVRNCGLFINNEINLLHKIFSSFASVSYLVIESDSNDSTVQNLELLKNSISSFRYISLGNLKTKYPKRTERIAYCRNTYLHELNTNSEYKDIECVVVTDLDGMNDLLKKNAVLSCWKDDSWDVCTTNQEGPYYDIWALRHAFLSPNDCFAHYQFLTETLNIGAVAALESATYAKMITIKPSCGLIDVDSAFGGLALYKRDTLRNVQYIGLTDENEEVCEHVALNQAIKKKGGRIVINPALINHKSKEIYRALSKKMRLDQAVSALFPALYKSRFYKKLKLP